jgi:2-oxoglutarate ferredoxin oxidoreductase subunit gamma
MSGTKKHYEIRFSGSGGQGMMLLGDILAEATGNYENKEIALTKSYGPESRGGACRSELIIDEVPINYPEVTRPDLVLAMTQLSCDKYHCDMDTDGILLIDPTFVRSVPEGVKNVYAIPMTQIAKDVAGKEIAANVVAMGAISVLGDFVKVDSVRSAVAAHFPEALRESNNKAFDAGVEAAKKLLS